MLTCREVTQLLSQGQDRKLSTVERLRLRLHLALCRGCANFKKQMDYLHLACRMFVTRASGNDGGD
ncbi:MAG: zf-HC2 domain-containing protein [Candidatus Accumulibacter sp.]|uniref:anti-sigma factor family protein n=1 Tax=Accumulibacter sp. TaxID=2053492 RepID=UPI0019FBDD3D|nr:zf-HC2 domain-containing protein [Accumulibacter sp.]MBE2258970.1 zf-HC2 domain-containing protein [Paracoccaceae bacterium]MCB1943405.1 zf-HC2 domain-containing protein [Accumulibacter sp.]MCP5249022.1 zf-HC2 domain-containing protein [Accumulibacter sp.]